ncbi:MAG: hypothetical protein HFG87_01245 [Dorea sp.]|nr:hypothetical protein [Dorea sp.]
MKKIELEFQENGIARLIELFNNLLEQCEFNLNQFVKGDALSISNEMPESFVESLKEFVKEIPDLLKELDEKDTFWSLFEKLDDYDKNNRFVMWLRRYADSIIRPFEEAKFLKEIDEQTFQKLTKYCFDNFIMKDIGKKRIDKSLGEAKRILVLRKIIFTFISMVIVENFSKENAFDNMEKMFGIKESRCEIWWDMVIENEEKLWRIMMMKQYSRIENKLNHLLEVIDE